MTSARGCFVVVEGPEGAGKSTLVRALAERLGARGADPLLVREPGGTPVAEAARAAMLDPAHRPGPVAELFLVLAARADLVATVIRPALDAGRLVLADRYDHSTRAYQVGARGLDAEAVRVANALATGGLRPDVTLILDADPAVGRARQAAAGKRPDRMELEDDDFHRRVHAAYRAERGPGVIHLGADRAPEAVLADAWAALAAARPDHFR